MKGPFRRIAQELATGRRRLLWGLHLTLLCNANLQVDRPVNVTNGGGLVGTNGQLNHNYGTITNSYATGNVTNGGGLVGTNWGTISNSHATGNVQGTGTYAVYDGGLVGINYFGATINQTYATGNVTASGVNYVGGLVGFNSGAGSAPATPWAA